MAKTEVDFEAARRTSGSEVPERHERLAVGDKGC
jgi:hypothetical protein